MRSYGLILLFKDEDLMSASYVAGVANPGRHH